MEGQELKQRRNKLGLTQPQLARFLKVSTDAVYRWENGKLPFLPHRKADFENIEAKFNSRKKRIENKLEGSKEVV